MEPQRIGPSNCLPKTQVCAKSKDDVYELTPVKAEVEALQNGIASLYPDINGLPALKQEASRFIILVRFILLHGLAI